MSAPRIVYRKTAAGLAEMQARRLDLPRKTFSLLLAIDGRRTREQLCSTLSAYGDVAAQLETLEEMGLIEDADTRANGAFSFAAPMARRRDDVTPTPDQDAVAPAYPVGSLPAVSTTNATGALPALAPHGIFDPQAPRLDAGPGQGADSAAATPALDNPETTTLWSVTEQAPVDDPLTRSADDLPGAPPPSGFVELDTWPGTAIRGQTGAPVWPRTADEAPQAASSSVPSGADAASPGADLAGLPPLSEQRPGPASEAQAPDTTSLPPRIPASGVPESGPGAGSVEGAAAGASAAAAAELAALSTAMPPTAPGNPGDTGNAELPRAGEMADLGFPDLPASRPVPAPAPEPPAGGQAVAGASPSAPTSGPISGAAVVPASVSTSVPTSVPTSGATAAATPGSAVQNPLAPRGTLPSVMIPKVTPLPPWSMPAPVRRPVAPEQQSPVMLDRSQSYPTAFNLIDIRSYIGVGRQRVDPLANLREAMSTVLTRNIDLQNYELLHAVESMQVREEFLHLLPYYLVDLDRRMSPADFREHVENLSRLSGMTTDALLGLMVKRREAEGHQDSPKSSGKPT